MSKAPEVRLLVTNRSGRRPPCTRPGLLALAGEVVVTYTDGKSDTCRESDLFYWPPGHSVRVVRDAEVILFSPHHEHAHVMDHMTKVMQGR